MLGQLQIGNQFANKNKQTTVTIEDANTKIKTCLTFILCESWRHKWLLKVPLDAYPCKKNISIIMTIHLNYFIKNHLHAFKRLHGFKSNNSWYKIHKFDIDKFAVGQGFFNDILLFLRTSQKY